MNKATLQASLVSVCAHFGAFGVAVVAIHVGHQSVVVGHCWLTEHKGEVQLLVTGLCHARHVRCCEREESLCGAFVYIVCSGWDGFHL